VLPTAVVGFLLIIAITMLTGALHLDGLADTCDGLGGHTVAERHRIMHDSRAGTFGVVAIASVLLLKYLTLVNIPAVSLTASLVMMPAVARWAMVYAITVFPYARPSGLGTVFKQGARLWHLAVASLLVLVAAGILMHWGGLVILAVVWLVTWALAGFCRRQFAGLTGDNYGAVNEIGEVTVLLTVLLLARNGWLLN
jgi:adenosylcobinamide-GDP ribazoletransferase